MTVADETGAPYTALDPALLRELGGIDTCTIANAIEVTGVRLRNEGYADSTVACLLPELPPAVGYAFTLRVRTNDPPIDGGDFVDRVDWWDQLLTVPPPRILVVEDVHAEPGTGSFLGEVHASVYRALGCAGIVTNGAVRDLGGLERLGFPAFAGHVAVSHAYAHIIEFGVPVTVGGLEVAPGELMHGDRHGVLAIPIAVAAALPGIVARNRVRERAIIDYCRSPERTVAGLKALLQQGRP